MPEILEDPSLREAIIGIFIQEYNLANPRDGMHVSDLIYCLTRSYWNKVDPLPATDTDLLRFSIGLGLERVFVQFEATRPTELFEEDGIVLSPDFILQGVHSELKTTRFSPGKWADTWLRQIAAYCYATDQILYNLLVLHIIQPALKAYRVLFTQEELEENWGEILARREILQGALDTQVPPLAFTYNEPWECNGCKYKLRCDLSASLLRLTQNYTPGTEPD